MHLPLLPEKIMHALCWALIHSLWQGIILAIVTGIIIMLTKKSSSALRYNLMTTTLGLFMIAVGYTFLYEIANNTNENFALNTQMQSISDNDHSIANSFTAIATNGKTIETTISFLDSQAKWIVLAWLLIIGFRCMQLLSGLRSISAIRQRQTFSAGEYWRNRLNVLLAQLKINRPVQLLQSGIAKVPMVIGHFKPVILIPLGFLNALTETEIEAILLHELAHIKRRDYLVNLLQTIAEVIFFFNPAVLWISSLIKDERENCCDDIVVNRTKNKSNYINALLSFQEYNLAAQQLANAFPGRSNHLLHRVKRIISNNNKTLNSKEKILLTSGIVIMGFVTITFSQVKQLPGNQKKTDTSEQTAATIASDTAVQLQEIIDTIPQAQGIDDSTHFIINETFEGKTYKIIEENGNVTELYINGQKIPSDKIPGYKAEIDKIKQAVKEEMKKQREELKKQAEVLALQKEELAKEMALMNKQQSETNEKLAKEDYEKMLVQLKLQQAELVKQSELMHKQSAEVNEKMRKDDYEKIAMEYLLQKQMFTKQADTLKKEQMEMDQRMNKENNEKLMKEFKVQQEVLAKQAAVMNKQRVEMEDKILKSEQDFKLQAEKLQLQQKQLQTQNYFSEQLIEYLLDESVITDRNNLSFRLTNDEFIVNGVKQPEEIHKKILEKYIKKQGDTISFSYNMGNSK